MAEDKHSKDPLDGAEEQADKELRDLQAQISRLIMSVEGTPSSCEAFTIAHITFDWMLGKSELVLESASRGHTLILKAHSAAVPEEHLHDRRCVLANPNANTGEWIELYGKD